MIDRIHRPSRATRAGLRSRPNEYPLVAWAEEHGLDVTYASDVTVDAHPGFVLQHRALVSLDHDEVWTYSERLAVQRAEQQGVNVMFLGSAAVLRHARLQASPLGADQEEVDYRDSAEDPLAGSGNPMQVTGNTWSSPPTNWPEISFVGELYLGYLLPNAAPAPFVVYDPSAWIFRGTGLRAGSEVPGVVASDIDHLAPAASAPAGLRVLGHSPVSLKVSYTNQGSWGGETYSDMTYYSDPTSHAGVFDSGTVHWVTTLTPCGQGTSSPCPAPMTQAITGNLFWLFGQGPAGRVDPSHPNWHSVRPSGS